jgi:hypothetical protein
LTDPESSSVLDLESACSEDLGGAGITGDATGATIVCCTTTTLTSHTAERLLIVTALAATARSTIAHPKTEIQLSEDLRHLSPSRECALARSVDLIMAVASVDFLCAGSRALEVDSTEEASMAAVDGISQSQVIAYETF